MGKFISQSMKDGKMCPRFAHIPIIFSFIIINLFSQNLKVHFVDIGQGDAILIQYLHKNYMIDAGKHRADNKLIDYLRSVSVDTIHAAVTTHPDADHFQAFEDIIDSDVQVLKFIRNKDTKDTQSWQSLLNAIEENNIPVDIVDQSDDLNWNLPTDILAPNYEWGFNADEYNENSIVVLLKYENVRFLFTGDAEHGANQQMLQNYNLNVDVLKVSHHGSKTGTDQELLNETSPLISIISAGKNGYGHPDKNIIQMLKDVNSYVFSTADDYETWLDSDGGSRDQSVDDDIIVETDGDQIWVNGTLITRTSDLCLDAPKVSTNAYLYNYPNPFNNATNLKFQLDRKSDISIKIFDIQGTLKEVLFTGELGQGMHTMRWENSDHSSGIYIIALMAKDFVLFNRCVLVK